MQPLLGELVGTMLLVLLGDGVVANVSLCRSKGQNAGGIVVYTAWGMAVFVGAYVAATMSGAHLNPAVTIGNALAGNLSWSLVPGYLIGQFIGAFIGATLVWLAYLPHWAETPDPAVKLGVFATGPAIRSAGANLLCEIIGTFVLMLGLLGIHGVAVPGTGGAATAVSMGALGIIPAAFLVWVIGMALGGPTGYAINPARDLGPRIMHAILPIPGKGGSDWAYSWIPVVGPIVGAVIAALLWVGLGRF